MSIYDEISKAFDESIIYIGESITYKGQNIPAFTNNVTISEEMIDGGLRSINGIKAIIRKNSFLDPQIGETVIFEGDSFRIMEVVKDRFTLEMTLAKA